MQKAPLFIKIDEYKDVVDIIALTKDRLQQANTLLEKIATLKQKEDEAIGNWSKELAEVEQLVQSIDNTLAHPEN